MHIGPGGSDMRGQLFLGDFVTGAAGPDGIPYVVFPQSCNEGCQGNAQATANDAKVLGTVVALQGWSLKG